MLSESLNQTLEAFSARTGNCADLVVLRTVLCGISCALLTCEGTVSAGQTAEQVLEPLRALSGSYPNGTALLAELRLRLPLACDMQEADSTDAVLSLLYAGFAVLLADGAGSALCFGVQGFAVRGISEPSGELNIYGAKEGFTEPIRTNLSLIRRRMRSPLMRFEMHHAGTVSQTELCICWLSDRVQPDLLDGIRKKLDSLPLETVLSSGYVRPFLEERDTQLIHSVGTTERPDIFCAKLLEGRVGILIDGTPFALVIPQLFCETFQTLDDYNYPPAYATLLRWLKYAAALISLLLPGAYLAAALHHPELLNETLLRLLTDSEQQGAFSIAAEMLGILFMYETVREAGLRLPKAVGGAVSLIGGLLIGDAAVQSGLVSTPVLTVTALSVTAGFIIPEHHPALTVLRPAFVLIAAAAGIPGIALLLMLLIYEICSTEVFGIPVSAPVSPMFPAKLREILGRIGFTRLSQGNFRIYEIREK